MVGSPTLTLLEHIRIFLYRRKEECFYLLAPYYVPQIFAVFKPFFSTDGRLEIFLFLSFFLFKKAPDSRTKDLGGKWQKGLRVKVVCIKERLHSHVWKTFVLKIFSFLALFASFLRYGYNDIWIDPL